MKKRNKKPLIFMILVIGLALTIGATVAYYTSDDLFQNEFNAGTYSVTTSEVFESPDNWTPGTTTPKTVKVTNNGSVPVAVRIQIIERWKDEQGNFIDLYDSQNRPAAIINYADGYTTYWNHTMVDRIFNEDLTRRVNQYHYNVALGPGEETIDLIESVTFNPNVEIEKTVTTTEDPVTHEKTYTTTYSGYSGGKYTMDISVSTVQYDQYETVWGPTGFYVNDPDTDFTNMTVRSIEQNNVFGKTMNRNDIESITFLNDKTVPNDAIESWDASQLSDSSVMAWIKDADSDGKYELYVGANGGVRANSFCNNYFAGYNYVHTLDLTYLDTSNVKSMYFMFISVGSSVDSTDTLDIIGLEDLNTSNVTNMENAFTNTGGTGKTYDFSNWDVSKVKNMDYMFFNTKFTYTGTDNWPLN